MLRRPASFEQLITSPHNEQFIPSRFRHFTDLMARVADILYWFNNWYCSDGLKRMNLKVNLKRIATVDITLDYTLRL